MNLPKRLRDRILDTVVVKYLHLEMQIISFIYYSNVQSH
jgi:hypothetical protein